MASKEKVHAYIRGRPYITYTLREGGWVAVGCTLMYCGGWVGSALMYVLIVFKEFQMNEIPDLVFLISLF